MKPLIFVDWIYESSSYWSSGVSSVMGSNEGTVEGLFGEMMGDGATSSIKFLKFLTICFPILIKEWFFFLFFLFSVGYLKFFYAKHTSFLFDCIWDLFCFSIYSEMKGKERLKMIGWQLGLPNMWFFCLPFVRSWFWQCWMRICYIYIYIYVT